MAATTSTSADLLAVAASLFHKHGYEATTTRQIADQLKIRNASLYHHMEGKEDLLYRICIESMQRVSDAVVAAIQQEVDARERLETLIQAHVSTMLKDYKMNATMLFELRSLSRGRRVEVVRMRDEYERLVKSLVADAQRTGQLRTDISADHLTLMLMNLLNWTMIWYRPNGELRAPDVGQLTCAVFFNGAVGPDAKPASTTTIAE